MASKVIKIEFEDGTVQVIAPDPIPTPPPGPASLIKGGYFDGIPDNQAKAFADQFGIGWARIWHTINWNEAIGPSHPTMIRAAALQAQGLRVLVVATPPEKTGAPPSSPDIAYNYFTAFAKAGADRLGAAEIWNEPNLSNYNTDYTAHASSWITNGLGPAFSAFRQVNKAITVISGGWSEGPDNGFAYAVQKGLLNVCDAVGYHPYGANAPMQVDRVRSVRNLIGATKPLWLTEWNLHNNPNDPSLWTYQLKQAAWLIAPYIQAVFYFRLVQTAQPAGVAAPLDVNLNRRPIWYDGTVAAMGAFT